MATDTASLKGTAFVPQQADRDDTAFFPPPAADREELASAKLWAVYINEAEKYDKALVGGWKSDMEGLLIFAGLFSASLTAFLMESYRTLTPDQGAITIALLTQISNQLDPSSAAKAENFAGSSSFKPSPASLACNTLWFLSLWLSLSCALMATLVEQWARDFIQRTEMRPSPVIRARIFSYLYFGIQRFGMHTMVEFLPFLLHLSLLLFLAGLVAFLFPINQMLMVVAAVLLVLISATYIYLTVLPIISSDSPYRTPMTRVAWGIFRRISSPYRRRKTVPVFDVESKGTADESAESEDGRSTIVEEMVRDAMAESPKRDRRDGRAIVWTIRSLTDNSELEPLVAALPDLIWGPNGRRRAYDQMITMLLDSPDVRLIPRIETLLRSCDSGVLHSELETRRRTSCIKALWAIAYFLACDAPIRVGFPAFDVAILASQLNHPHALVRCYSASAYWLVRWIGYCSFFSLVKGVWFGLEVSIPVRDPGSLSAAIQREADARGYTGLVTALSQIESVHHGDIPLMEQVRSVLRSLEQTAYDTILEYMESSATMPEMPYEFEATCQIMQPFDVFTSRMPHAKLKATLSTVLDGSTATIKALDRKIHHLDIIVGTILSILQTGDLDSFENAQVGRAVIKYAAPRRYGEGLRHTLGQCDPHRLGSLLTKYLAGDPGNLTQNTLYSIWVLCVSTPQLATFDEETLAAVSVAPVFPISPCVTAALKSQIVTAAAELPSDELDSLMDRLQISNPASDRRTPVNSVERWHHAPFTILIEFLEHDATVPEPGAKSRATDTFRFLARRCTQQSAPQSLQLRFAAWFRNILHDPSLYASSYMIWAIIDWLYNSTSCEPFDDKGARRTIGKALASYAAGLSPDNEVLRGRAKTLVATLNSTPRINVDVP